MRAFPFLKSRVPLLEMKEEEEEEEEMNFIETHDSYKKL